MRDVLDDLIRWSAGSEPAGLATVVASLGGGAPRPVGAAMAVGPDGTAVGGVSGGCVEAAVYDLAREVAVTGRPQLARFAGSPDDVFAVSRPCGGELLVFVERVDRSCRADLRRLESARRQRVPVAAVTCVEPADHPLLGRRHLVGPAVRSGSDDEVAWRARALLAGGTSELVRVDPDGPGFFVASYRPAPRMLLLGSAHGVAALADVGSLLGYHVTVCDPRPVFTTQQRFPSAAEVVVRWPDEYLRDEASAGRLDARTVLCVLTHDLKTALPALDVALRLPVGYIGVMGSRRSQLDLRDRLLAAGHDTGALDRLAAPIGLDLGAVDSAEMAVSVAAEIVTMVRGGTGQRLSALRGPIHAAPAPVGM